MGERKSGAGAASCGSRGWPLDPDEEHESWFLLNQVRDTMIRLRDREVRHLGITSIKERLCEKRHSIMCSSSR